MVGHGVHRVDQRHPGPAVLPRSLPAPRPRRARLLRPAGSRGARGPGRRWPPAYGISGFVYYHYWFHGKRLLERPLDEVLASGSPDFPFALCWANEEWTRNWDARTGQVLMPQEFSDEDDLAHIRWLATAFADDRYIKIDGRPLMLDLPAGAAPRPASGPPTSGGPRRRGWGSPTSTCAGWRAGGRRPVDRRPSASTPPSGSCRWPGSGSSPRRGRPGPPDPRLRVGLRGRRCSRPPRRGSGSRR